MFHVLAIIDSAVMNVGVHVSLSILVSSVCMPSSGIAVAVLLPVCLFFFLKESPHCSPIVAVLVCIPTNSVKKNTFESVLMR